MSVLSDIHKAIVPAGVSVSSATLSVTAHHMTWFQDTLPLVQWLSAVVAIVSGVTGITWVVLQILNRKRL